LHPSALLHLTAALWRADRSAVLQQVLRNSRTRVRTGVALALTGLVACSADMTAPQPDAGMPVVQSVLLVGASRHVIWVEWAIPADSLISDDLRPLPPALVNLWLVPPTADSIRFEPVSTSPGAFEVVGLSVEPEQEYRLSGAVNGIRVSARTRTPGELQIFAPETDTIRVSRDCGLNCPLAYHWHAPGASAYEFTYGGARTIRGIVRDTSGVLGLQSSSGVSPFRILAYNPEAVDFYVSSIVNGNVQGVFGAFAAASTAARVIAWE
jgi:hypothetical protein